MHTQERPCSLKYNVSHPRQDKNHKRYFHENLAHHANFGNAREFDRPDKLRRVNSIVPAVQVRGQMQVDNIKDKRQRGAQDLGQVITQHNQVDKEMLSTEQ